jgi:hypothetical protein
MQVELVQVLIMTVLLVVEAQQLSEQTTLARMVAQVVLATM